MQVRFKIGLFNYSFKYIHVLGIEKKFIWIKIPFKQPVNFKWTPVIIHTTLPSDKGDDPFLILILRSVSLMIKALPYKAIGR